MFFSLVKKRGANWRAFQIGAREITHGQKGHQRKVHMGRPFSAYGHTTPRPFG